MNSYIITHATLNIKPCALIPLSMSIYSKKSSAILLDSDYYSIFVAHLKYIDFTKVGPKMLYYVLIPI